MILLLTNFTGGSLQRSGSVIGELQKLQAGKAEDRDPEIEIFPQTILNNLFRSMLKKMILKKLSDHSIFWQ